MFRSSLPVLALVLAGFSLWIWLSEAVRSAVHQLPADRDTAVAAAAQRTRAGRAASFGAVRGDLWSEAAYTYAAPLWLGSESASEAGDMANEGRPVIERALAHAPHDAGVWLLAASLASQFHWPNSDAAAMLKMSYYTGPNETGLVPLRLFAAIRQGVLADSELQRFVQRDIRMVLTQWSQLKYALIAAYRVADPPTKRFIENAVTETDPAFVQIMRSGGPP
jgi:hypothetical protein